MNPRILQALKIAGATLAVFLIVGVYEAGRDELPKPPDASNILAPHGGYANGERIASRSWSFRYQRLVASADQTVVDVYGVTHGVIFKGGKPYLRVHADHLTVNTVTHDFSATGKLHVWTASRNPRRTFITTSVTWVDATQRLAFMQPTTIESGTSDPLVVSSMTLNVKNGDVDIHDVRGAIRFK